MKRFLLFTYLIIACLNIIQAKPTLTSPKYLIATLSNNAIGTVSPGTETYPLIYNPDKSNENAEETDYWIINNISDDLYTFRNASTGKYIQYNTSASSDRTALVLVDDLQSDNSTSFTLELKNNNSLCYYIIRSAVNTAKIWDKRSSLYESVYPVGVYSGTGSDNEQFIFYDSSGNSVKDETPVVLPTANRTLGVFTNYLTSLTFNEKTPIVDKNNNAFYLSINPEQMNNNVAETVKFTLLNSSYKLYINGTEVASNSSYTFNTVSAKNGYKIEIKNGSSNIASGTIYFSCLPLVQLYSDDAFSTVYSLGRIAVTEPNKSDSTEVLLTNIKYRGAISLNYAKKSFALNLRNATGDGSDDRSFFSLREDNNWILDAMYIDPARMRNRVNTDLWHSYAKKPYWFNKEPDMINGTRGHFVEVFINDAYQGLFCMTEKVDRKQLKLKKLKSTTDENNQTTYIQRGTSFKATNWSSPVMYGYPYEGSVYYPTANNNSITWASYECKYPELDEGQPITWENLVAATKVPNSYYTTDDEFKSKVATTFDLPVYLDYYLLIDLLLAVDNHGKNSYTNIYDQTSSTMVSITPWDLDGTWGIRWDGSKNLTGPKQNLDTFLIKNEHGQMNLYLRLKKLNVNDWNTQLKERYRYLRGNAFNYDSLINRFQTYADLFALSGADTREINKWGSYGLVKNISSEMDYISNWITDRLAFLDMEILGQYFTGVNENKYNLNITFTPNPVIDILKVSGLEKGELVSVYTLQGAIIAQKEARETEVQINLSSYPAGIYMVKTNNNYSKIIKK